MGVISISKTIRSRWSVIGYEEIVRAILGKKQNLSIVLIGDKKAQTLNKTYRNKNKSANILTFPLGENVGEIFINIAGVKKEAHLYDLTPSGYAKYLLIHGCLHLKGYAHGSTMDKAENKFLKKFSIR